MRRERAEDRYLLVGIHHTASVGVRRQQLARLARDAVHDVAGESHFGNRPVTVSSASRLLVAPQPPAKRTYTTAPGQHQRTLVGMLTSRRAFLSGSL